MINKNIKLKYYIFIILFMISKQLRQKLKEEYCKEWFQFVLDNPKINWDYNILSYNPNITWDIVQSNP